MNRNSLQREDTRPGRNDIAIPRLGLGQMGSPWKGKVLPFGNIRRIRKESGYLKISLERKKEPLPISLHWFPISPGSAQDSSAIPLSSGIGRWRNGIESQFGVRNISSDSFYLLRPNYWLAGFQHSTPPPACLVCSPAPCPTDASLQPKRCGSHLLLLVSSSARQLKLSPRVSLPSQHRISSWREGSPTKEISKQESTPTNLLGMFNNSFLP